MKDFIKPEDRINFKNLVDTDDMENQGDYQEYDHINSKIIEYRDKLNGYITESNKPKYLPSAIFRWWSSGNICWYSQTLSRLYDRKTQLMPSIIGQYSRRIYGG